MVFSVEPDRQQELVDVLVEAIEEVMNKVPGFVSANIHKALDGTRVVNYAQWRSPEAFRAMLERETDAAAAPVDEKYTGMLAAADVFMPSTTFWVVESIRSCPTQRLRSPFRRPLFAVAVPRSQVDPTVLAIRFAMRNSIGVRR